MARGSTKKKSVDRPGQVDPTAPLDGGELLAVARPVLGQLREDLEKRAGDPRVDAALRARYEGEKTQTVILRISANGVPRVLERDWSGLQSVEKVAGGGITAHFSVGDMGEFERFLLAFGRDAEVLAPASLRRRLHEEARAMLANSKPL